MTSTATALQPAAGSLADLAYRSIRDLIVTVELRPGAVVDETLLGQRLAVGRTPTREALKRLAQEGLVDFYPRRGTFVTPVDIRDLADISEIRMTIEGEAARLAALRATSADRAQLTSLVDSLAEADPLDPRALIEADERVHHAIARAAHNRHLEAAVSKHYVLGLRIWYLALDRAEDVSGAVGQHGEILEAVLDGNPKEAETLMRAHIHEFEDAIRRVLA